MTRVSLDRKSVIGNVVLYGVLHILTTSALDPVSHKSIIFHLHTCVVVEMLYLQSAMATFNL